MDTTHETDTVSRLQPEACPDKECPLWAETEHRACRALMGIAKSLRTSHRNRHSFWVKAVLFLMIAYITTTAVVKGGSSESISAIGVGWPHTMIVSTTLLIAFALALHAVRPSRRFNEETAQRIREYTPIDRTAYESLLSEIKNPVGNSRLHIYAWINRELDAIWSNIDQRDSQISKLVIARMMNWTAQIIGDVSKQNSFRYSKNQNFQT